jgi:D-inositol-3-phosphate glycosyltransferase
MTMKRVAMLSVHTCPLAMLGGKETGGMNVYVRELTTELDRQGIVVDVYTRSQEPGTPVVHGILGEQSRVIHVPAGPEVPYDKNRVYDHLSEFVERVKARVIRENLQYDIIHSHYWLSALAARDLQKTWGGIPIVQMFHTLGEMKNRVAQSEAERETSRRVEFEEQIMGFVDKIIAATPIDKEHMVSLYGADPSKIEVIPPGVNLSRFHRLPKAEARQRVGVGADHKMILFVGRIQRLKGIDTLMRAMALIRRDYPSLTNDLCISIIGGGTEAESGAEAEEFQRLQSLKAELAIDDLVTFLGAKDQDVLVNYYAAAEMVVMPSHYESFGMVALEAMACGTPVIASDVGGLTFIVEDGFNGYLVPSQDAAALAEKIVLLLCYPYLREHLGEQARHWVERFSWEAIGADIVKLYQKTRRETALSPAF